MNHRLTALIQEMPKGENHLHIEGSLSGTTCFQLAKKKGIVLPFASPEALDRHFFTHVVDLDSFLDCYRLINTLCVTDEDYYDTVLAIGEDAWAQNIIYRELMLDFPMTAAVDGAFGRVASACHHATAQIQQRYGIEMPLIVCVDRSQPPEACLRYLRGFEPYLDSIDGIGLDYEEVGYPPVCMRICLHWRVRWGCSAPPM